MEKIFFTIGMLTFSCCLGRLALSDRAQEARWSGVSYAGAGCLAGSVMYSASAGTGLKLRFAELGAVSGVGGGTEAKCTLNVGVRVESGFQVGIGTVVAKGTVKTGASGEGATVVRFSEVGGEATEEGVTFAAGTSKAYESVADRVETTWLPCGESTTLTVEANVTATGESRVILAKMEIPALAYRRCSAVTP